MMIYVLSQHIKAKSFPLLDGAEPMCVANSPELLQQQVKTIWGEPYSETEQDYVVTSESTYKEHIKYDQPLEIWYSISLVPIIKDNNDSTN